MIQLAGIIILGILAQWLAWRIRVPAILPLIIIGLLVGPLSTLLTPSGNKLLEPIYNEQNGGGLFPGEYLFYFVSLSIGVILFEGGLTLKRREIQGVGPAIVKLITVGSLITFIGAGLAAHFITGLSWPISFQIAALIIVTGPTVIAPILQNVPLNRNVATVLKWEGILIDPLGALVAVLVFEFIRTSDGGAAFTSHAFVTFFQIILIGLALGGVGAYTLYWLIKVDMIPRFLLNVFTLAFVLSIFVLSDILAHESGLLSVVVMGMVLGNLDIPQFKEILHFKESLSVLLISILFILLSAHIEMQQLELIVRDWRTYAFFGTVALVLRPAGVFASTINSELRFREKIFISWVGPRGIVAAGIASLFGLTLTKDGVPGAEYITPLVFMIVLGTVLLNATTARAFARALGVIQESSTGILFIGANAAARLLAKYLHDSNRHVVMVDTNESNLQKARKLGVEAISSNIYTDDLNDQIELVDIGYLIAMTMNHEVNNYAVKRYRNVFGEMGTFRLITPDELKKDKLALPRQGIFSYTDDFLNLNEVARDYPEIHELELENKAHFAALVKRMGCASSQVPLFIKAPSGDLSTIPYDPEQLEVEAGSKLVYMGEPERAA